jgi:phosphatidylglycerophosphate synthase
MPSSRPSIAELRAVTQAGIVERRSAEHWAGRLYMRPLSPYVTRELIRTPVTPDQLTAAMILVGLAAAVVVAWPGIGTAVAAVLLIQVYLLLDCVDGEVARWQRRTSATGVYLDRLGHHVVEGAFVVGLGFRAGGGPDTVPSWWYTLGAVAALLVVLGKLESDLVTVARAGAGLATDKETDPVSRVGGVRSLRRLVSYVPIHRLVGVIELSLLAALAAAIDAWRGDLVATQFLLVATAGVAAIVALGHPVTILTSERLR